MLLVLGLILILATLAVALIPRFQERERAAKGADHLQRWLLIAKQWAKRDKVPTGLRLTVSSGYVSDMNYIQQPEDWAPQGSTAGPSKLGANFVQITPGTGLPAIDLYNGNGAGSSSADWLVQKGDYIEFFGGGVVYQIQDIPALDTLTLRPTVTLPFNPNGTTQYRIIRQPRTLQGEQPLLMPQDVKVDGLQSLPDFSASTTFDILFSPSGEVIGSNAGTDKVIFWVRDVTQDLATPGEQTLIVVYVRTGFIAAHPVSQDINTTGQNNLVVGATSITVASSANINNGSYLVLDAGTASHEIVQVTAPPVGNVLTVTAVNNAHTAPFTVTDPYAYTRDGRSSGL
jgi:hypothetical protein